MWYIEQAKRWLTAWVWGTDLSQLPPWRRHLKRGMQILYLVVRDVMEGQLTLMAMSLVYTTLLSIVPLLAVSFSVLKAFGVHNQVEPVLLNVLEPLGEQGVEITHRIIGFVENMNVGVLGAMGLAFLIYTVITLLQKVESSFNYTWRVEQERSFGKRFSDYLSVIIIGPVLVFSAMGITASVLGTDIAQSVIAVEPLGRVIEFLSGLVPYALIILAFTFIYAFVPNTRVHVTSAFLGAVIAGFIWQSTGWIFGAFVVGSARYAAIYSAFATLILFMIWIYLSWVILLIGASIAFYHQHSEYVSLRRRGLVLSNYLKEKLALLLMYEIGRQFYRGQPPWQLEDLASHLRAPLESVERVVRVLESRGLLARTNAEPPTYLPAKPLDRVPVIDLIDAIRTGADDRDVSTRILRHEAPVERLSDDIEGAIRQALHGRTLRDLALSDGEQEGSTEPTALRGAEPRGRGA